MEIKDRISEIMKKEKLTPSIFSERIGIQRSALSHILNGRNNPSLDVIMKIHQAYNYISLEWLLYGKGEMCSSASLKEESQQPFLFDENTLNPSDRSTNPEYREEIHSKPQEMSRQNIVKQEIRYIEKPPRKITEIRIFFDDNTYETFRGEN